MNLSTKKAGIHESLSFIDTAAEGTKVKNTKSESWRDLSFVADGAPAHPRQ
jgi:hypothetical protein